MSLLDGLNDAQLAAVTTTEGPVMVMAGAGAGKTKVLTTRISYIIDELGISPYHILAVTFTNKAANEMKDRIAKMLGITTSKMWISTFHSFCSRLLRMEIEELEGYTKYFSIIDEDDSLKIVKNVINELDFDYKPKEIRKLISQVKNAINVNIKEGQLKSDFDIIFKVYNESLIKDNLLDFDDLILKVIELFQKKPSILQKYQDYFQYILVDEFQDTNTLQYNLMFMLAARYHNIFVVGDDFQSIYSFRGAKIENISRFKNDFLECKLILLEKNYRSTTQILNLANSVIAHNPNQIKKIMTSNNKEGKLPIYYHASSAYDEVMYVIDNIKKLKLNGYKYSDFAIMYRANYISRGFEDSLVRYQIPYKMYGGLSFFARKEIKDIIAFLRIFVNNDDDFSFKRIINVPKKGVGTTIINNLTEVAIANNCSLFKAISFYKGKGKGADSLFSFKDTVNSIVAQIENISLRDLIDLILKELNYEEELKSDKDTYEDRSQNIKEFKSVLKETEETYEGETNVLKLTELLSDLALRSDNDDASVDDAVVLTTYHQAKGLEFRCVFMVANEEGIFPSINVMLPSEIEEERRICYVGITRAKDNLFITNSANRALFGSYENMLPSRFIKEMDEELYDNANKVNLVKTKNIFSAINQKDKKMNVSTSPEISIGQGDKINHKIFGDGIVVATKGDTITVAFKNPDYGIKVLKANHPNIRKL
ncbi:MAG: ATP-dependent helicase [Anaeroplasma sp.]